MTEAVINRRVFATSSLFAVILTIGFCCNLYLKLASAINAIYTNNTTYLVSTVQSGWMLLVFVTMIICTIFLINVLERGYLLRPLYLASAISCATSIFGVFISDVLWMFAAITKGVINATFNETLGRYFREEWWLYASFLFLIALLIYILRVFDREKIKGNLSPNIVQMFIFIIPIILPLVLFPYIINTVIFIRSDSSTFSSLSSGIIFSSIYLLTMTALWFFTISARNKHKIQNKFFMKLAGVTGVSAAMAFCIPLFSLIYANKHIILRGDIEWWTGVKLFSSSIGDNLSTFVELMLVIAASAIARQYFRKKQFSENNTNTSGKFGSACWATNEDLRAMHAYDPNNGLIIGADNYGSLLYLPFTNKLTLSPPGGGKTTSSSIPVLLSHPGPAFVFDVKGELWATTARYRSEVLGHKIIVIDPYGVTKSPDFQYGKSQELLIDHRINPFDFISEDEGTRDRMINAFASSFVISDDSGAAGARHFDDNAKILIRGLIDYMMKKIPKENRNLALLYKLLSENSQDADVTFTAMQELAGRSAAASNQVSRVGSNERGSILSTSYRQIDWMSDSNMQFTLSKSDFNLYEFLKGNMDIFVILPQDQIKEHSRLVRMVMSLLLGIIIQASPSELPKQKILFLLEELAQLGYCPDVEQSIEVLRARGVVVWTVFQSLSQIEIFKKPDLFKGVALKQIFTLDDVKTMQWIQMLGGKETVMNKSISSNVGDSRKKMQAFGGTISQGQGENIQEVGIDLIRLNEIREMPNDEQFIFLHSVKPIRCKKVRYFEHPYFAGKYDINPVETRNELSEVTKHDE